MERAVGAERMAERNMRVEHVLVSFLRRRRILENNRIAVQIAAGVVIHHAVGKTDHPIGQELARLRDEVGSAGHEDAEKGSSEGSDSKRLRNAIGLKKPTLLA